MKILQPIGVAWRFAMAGRRRWYLLGAAALLVAGWIWLAGVGNGGGADYLTAALERGPLRNSVAATGTLQAVLTVQVGSQVTGRIAALDADFNSVVRKGQVLARIDPANFEAQLERARADLADAKAGIRTAEAAVATQKANLVAAKVAAQDALRALTRSKELGNDGIVSTRDLEIAQAAHDESAARVEQSQAQVRSAEAGLEQARARVDQAQAAVKIAEVNLVYTVITSPVDGVVISRSVDVGQTVSASLQAPTVFNIANDLTKMQVVANVDEADIGSIGADARATFTVDAFPGETFTGSLNQIRLNPQTQQNVVTYSVIVDVSNPDLKLRPGMTANTNFVIAERTAALRLPNAALRFWPEGVPRENERDLIAQAGGRVPGEAGSGTEPAPPSRTEPGLQAATPDAPRAEGLARRPPGAAERPGERSSRWTAEGGGGQLPAAGEVIRFPALRKQPPRPRVVWILGEGGKPEPRVVRTGITDGSVTEILDGALEEGDPVIIGRNVTPDQLGQQSRSPFIGTGPPMAPRRTGR